MINNVINLIYSYLGEHPILENTDITDSIESLNFDIEPSDDYKDYILRLQEFGYYI